MTRTGKDILIKFQRRWQFMRYLEVLLYALGVSILVGFLFFNFIAILSAFMLVLCTGILILKPWELHLARVSSYIDRELESAQYSSSLLLLPQNQLSGLAQLQQQKLSLQLEEDIKKVKTQNNLLRAGVITLGLVLVGFISYQFNLMGSFQTSNPSAAPQEIIVFHPADSASAKNPQPVLKDQRVTISYPAYTGVKTFTTSNMNIKAVEGSRVTWLLKFDTAVDSVQMEGMGSGYAMTQKESSWSRTSMLNKSGFYNFRYSDTSGATYVSNLYSIELSRDLSPVIEVTNLKQFTSFNFDEDKGIAFNSTITDDYGIEDAYIIATVSKGTGESVKFREEKLRFEEAVQSGNKNLRLSKKINLDQLKMEPGDELYFYVEALDRKQPVPNRSRSETYFAVIKDTVSYGYGVEGSLGVDLMPDYFRSQRQLIIDTEKLISQRNKIPAKEFNSTSNNLGFDQKALRLKYGQFMGDESEGGLDTSNLEMPGEEEDHHDHEQEEKDPLAAFTHDHDGENEHNLVAPAHEHGEEEEEDNPITKFLHDHGDPESSTLFTDSLKSKLRQALGIMWDAELHLRMYEPEKSLPYQYQALDLIQEIKNSARIYVHRIGFDPPPIKEDVRLTGKLDEVSSFQKSEDLEKPEKFEAMQGAVLRLEQLLVNKTNISAQDRQLFEQAGNELAQKAIEEPGKFLNTLQQLKWLTQNLQPKREILAQVQSGLLKALPQPEASPGKEKIFMGGINELLLKELENDK